MLGVPGGLGPPKSTESLVVMTRQSFHRYQPNRARLLLPCPSPLWGEGRRGRPEAAQPDNRGREACQGPRVTPSAEELEEARPRCCVSSGQGLQLTPQASLLNPEPLSGR